MQYSLDALRRAYNALGGEANWTIACNGIDEPEDKAFVRVVDAEWLVFVDVKGRERAEALCHLLNTVEDLVQ